MARGYISGIIFGILTGGTVIAAASLLTELPSSVAVSPTAEEVAVPGGSEFDQAKPDTTPIVPGSDMGRDARATATLELPSPESAGIDIPGRVPENAPDALQNTQPLETPTDNAAGPAVTPGADIDVALALPSEIVAPVATAPPRIGDAPTPPVSQGVIPTPEEAPQSEAPTSTAPVTDVEPQPDDAPGTDAEPGPAPAASAEAEETGVTGEQDAGRDNEQVAEPGTIAAPEVAEIPGADAADTPNPSVQPEPAQPQPEAGTAPSVGAEETRPIQRIGVPVGEITNQAPDVRTNLLPRIGDEQRPPPEVAAEAEVGVAGADGAQEEAPAAAELSALDRNRVSFDNPDNRPVLSVILLDDGDADSAALRDAARDLPFPVSFAVSVADADAGSRAGAYRSAGFEVLMVLSLPEGARPADIEVAFLSAAGEVPDAVAILDSEAENIAQNRAVSRQVAEILAESGHGLVVYDRGLNTARQVAARNGVANALIFRTLDADGAPVGQIRRGLDRAAFRAQQEGSVVVLGHLRSETLTALAEWAIEDRAAALVMGPVSAVLALGR